MIPDGIKVDALAAILGLTTEELLTEITERKAAGWTEDELVADLKARATERARRKRKGWFRRGG